ncbi:NADH-quinone oxidoreductase subunit N [Thermodesulfitimonas autotrophica]|uniref:NADH-quinone oxidoreductase subunit N n=1 Tax=Thermodesulfitimonas autotrophica TaxID=1894989 RepID=A0A3N5APX0_9THEO|nr:NADH-quinone oxidoreductase subunit N [Thermodesulfitimonas autotrophica]RPF46914.1 NADH-quinone oxidoreductase subunit N [Thermodesulfitimonas autotrophica]
MSAFLPVLPELTMLLLGLITFIVGVLTRRHTLTIFLAILSISSAAFLIVVTKWTGVLEAGSFISDSYSMFFRVIICMTGVLILALSHAERATIGDKTAEFAFLVIISVFGMCLMAGAGDLIVVYLALETFSLSSYVLAGFLRKDRRSIEAGSKYFILGTVASILLLVSIAVFYGLTGTTSIEEIGRLLKDKDLTTSSLASVFLICAFAFKLSLAPFHAWAPDVYEGSPTVVTAFFSVGPKTAAFAALGRIFMYALGKIDLTVVIIILSVLSMFIGNLLALRQTNLKRMFAYSSIAHAGYIVMAFLLTKDAFLSSIMPYLLTYAFMNIGAFAVVLSIKEGEKLSSYSGVAKIRPLLGFSMTVILFSLTGIPPTAGFIVKFNIFKNVFMAGYPFLALLAVLLSIPSAFYYLRIVLLMYRDAHVDPQIVLDTKLNQLNQGVSLASALFLLFAGIMPTLTLPL